MTTPLPTPSRKELLEEMDYSGGINQNKMYPPEDVRWSQKFIEVEKIAARLEELKREWRKIQPNGTPHCDCAVNEENSFNIAECGFCLFITEIQKELRGALPGDFDIYLSERGGA